MIRDGRIGALLVATLSVAGCDCGERTLVSRAVALGGEWDAAASEIDLAELPEGYRVFPTIPEMPRVGLSLDRAFVDESPYIREQLRMRAEWTGDDARRPDLPSAPEAMVVFAELDEGRLRDGDEPTAIATRLAPVVERLRKGDEHRNPFDVDLYADRRIPIETIRAVMRAFEEHDVVVGFVVDGPNGPQPLPFKGAMMGPPACHRTTIAGHAPPDTREPRTSPLEPVAVPDVYADPCEYQRAFVVAIVDGGFVVTDSVGTITPDFENVRVGEPDLVTVPRREGRLDFAALERGLRRLREIYPGDEDVHLELPVGGVTLDEYVGTWRALRGPPDAPIFTWVY